jgi:hypothetical protein
LFVSGLTACRQAFFLVSPWLSMRYFIFLPIMGSVFFSSHALAQQSLSNRQFLRPASQQWQVYADVSMFAADDAIPVREFESDWSSGYSPKSGRNLFLLRNRAELGVEKDGWQIGLEYRQQGGLDASHEMVEFYHLYQQRDRPAQPRQFDVNGKFTSWSSKGLRLAHLFALGTANENTPLLLLSGSVYERPRQRDMDVVGQVNYQSNDVYSVNAQTRESNTRYQYPFMQDVSQTGSGASVSLALQWPLSERWSANVAINDLWSRMQWSYLPAVEKRLNSDVTSYDKDGYVNYRPLLSGQNSQINKQSRIGASGALSLSYRVQAWNVRTSVDYLEGTYIPAVSASYQSRWGNFSGSYESRFRSIGLGYDIGPLRLHLRSNRWDINQASALGLDTSLNFSF